jgi:hypothetical protein
MPEHLFMYMFALGLLLLMIGAILKKRAAMIAGGATAAIPVLVWTAPIFAGRMF